MRIIIVIVRNDPVSLILYFYMWFPPPDNVLLTLMPLENHHAPMKAELELHPDEALSDTPLISTLCSFLRELVMTLAAPIIQ